MEEGKLPRSQESRVGKDSLSGSKPRISRAYLSVDLGTQSYLSAAGRPASWIESATGLRDWYLPAVRSNPIKTTKGV